MPHEIGSRIRILERIRTERPRLVTAVAGLGWGKTHLGRAFCAAADSGAIVGFRGVKTAEEAQGRLDEGLGGPWTSPHDVVVLDDADELAALEGGTLLNLLLATLPGSRMLVLTARPPFQLAASDLFAPHEILSLHREDFTFTDDEVREIVGAVPMPTGVLERAVTRAMGWPIMTFLLARLAREEKLVEALDNPASHVLDAFHQYYRAQLATIPQNIVTVITAIAALERASADEISAAAGFDAKETLADLERRRFQLLLVDAGTYGVITAIQGAIVASFPNDVREMRKRAAAFCSSQGRHVRAAKLAAAAAEFAMAAEFLDAAGRRAANESVSSEYQAVADSLPLEYVLRSKHIFLEYFTSRRTRARPYATYARVRAFCDALTPDVDPFVRYSAWIALTAMLRITIRGPEAERQARHCEAMSASFPDARDRHALLKAETAMILAWRGRAADAEAIWSTFDETESPGSDWFSYIHSLMSFAVALCRADTPTIAQIAQKNNEIARLSGDPAIIIQSLSALILATISTDAVSLQGTMQEMERVLASIPSKEEADNLATRFIMPYEGTPDIGTHVACVLGIHAALGQTDRDVAARLLRESIRGLDITGGRYFQVAARLAACHVSSFDRATLVRECIALCEEMQEPAATAQIRAFADGTEAPGPFAHILAAIQRAPLLARTTAFRIRLLDGKVSRDGRDVRVRNREFELLAHLALAGGPVSAASLCEAIWPDADEEAAVAALRMSIHRLRKQLDSSEAVGRATAGYELGPNISVDVLETEATFSALRRLGSLNEDDRSSLHALFQYVCTANGSSLEGQSWYDRVSTRIEDLRRGSGLLLAKEYLRIDEPIRCIEIAEALLRFDPLDEEAIALSVQALTAAGDKSAATRLWQQYVKRLAKDYGAQPSISFAELTLR